MARWPEPAVGIPKPDHDREYALSFQEMRAEIMKASRNSALVRQCVIRWEREGHSGEELMVMVAYHALRMLEEEFQLRLEAARLAPMPPMDVRPEGKTEPHSG